MIKLTSNEFWGLRSGYYDPRIHKNTGLPNGFRIDLTKWGAGRENSRPVGRKARKRNSYENAKLKNKNYAS